MTEIFRERFGELLEQLKLVEATKHFESNPRGRPIERLDVAALQGWRVKARNLLSKACGQDSPHYVDFVKVEDVSNQTFVQMAAHLRAIFEAAHEDFERGMLVTLRAMVRGEVFGDELEQAGELLENGYLTAAAVVAGTVLETTLRELCTRHGIAVGTMNKMNADLAKAGAYNLVQQQSVISMAAVRNAAAHGNSAAFGEADVRVMLAGVQAFVGGQT
jgi:hypothetical protein